MTPVSAASAAVNGTSTADSSSTNSTQARADSAVRSTSPAEPAELAQDGNISPTRRSNTQSRRSSSVHATIEHYASKITLLPPPAPDPALSSDQLEHGGQQQQQLQDDQQKEARIQLEEQHGPENNTVSDSDVSKAADQDAVKMVQEASAFEAEPTPSSLADSSSVFGEADSVGTTTADTFDAPTAASRRVVARIDDV